jgi:hypothetical protein
MVAGDDAKVCFFFLSNIQTKTGNMQTKSGNIQLNTGMGNNPLAGCHRYCSGAVASCPNECVNKEALDICTSRILIMGLSSV